MHAISPARARIGLLPTGHSYYWDQFPRLKEMGLGMYRKLRALLEPYGGLVAHCPSSSKPSANKARRTTSPWAWAATATPWKPSPKRCASRS